MPAVTGDGSRCREERDAGRRRACRQRSHSIQSPHFDAFDALAQHGLECGLESGLDAQLAEQARQPIQTLRGKPGIEARICLDARLHLPQCRQACLDTRQGVLRGGALVEMALALRRRCGDLLLGFRLRRGLLRQPGLEASHVFAEGRQLLLVGRADRGLLFGEALAPLLQRGQLTVQIALLCSRGIDRLFRQRSFGPRGSHRLARDAVRRLERRQRGLARPAGRLRLHQPLGRVGDRLLQRRRPREQFAAFVEAARARGLQRLDLRQQPRAAVDDHSDFRLQTGHFGVDLQQPALRLVYRIAGAVVRGANILELALGRAQFRHMAFKRGRPRLDVPDDLVTLGVGLAPSQQPQHLLLLVVRRLHVAIPRRNFGLLLELLDLAIELLQDVVDARQVLARVARSRFSVSRRRSLYFEMPAASSRKTRSSSGRASTMREIMPCSMMA